MVSVRTPRNGGVDQDGHPINIPWLEVIWACNDIDDTSFGAPIETKDWWAGGTVEEYEHFRVIHREDPSVSIVAKDDHGKRILREAAEKLDIHIN